MDVWWFSRVVAHHPYAILIAVFVFSSTCLIVPFATKKFPDFSDPQLGFEARGTVLAQRLTAWQNLMEATQPRGELMDNPLEYYHYLQKMSQQNKTNYQDRLTNGPRKKNRKNKDKGQMNAKFKNDTRYDRNESKDKWEELRKLGSKDHLDSIEDHENHSDNDGFFCNLPSSAYSRVVLSSETEDKSLWSMEGVLAQCHIDAALRSNAGFLSLCQTQSENGAGAQKCCRSWSPANFVALLSNRSSCLGVTESDLGRVEILLQRCAYFYHNLQLTPDCADNLNCQKRVPVECYAHNAPYHLLHYLLDVNFIPVNKQGLVIKINSTLRSAMLILPIAASSATLDYYKSLNLAGLSYGKFRVIAIEFGLKSTLFDRLLVSDSSLLLSGFAFITICIWAYTTSFLLTVTTILAVLFSLGISYAIYTLVLRISFFPFMNLLAVVVAVGIGADDAFIYCKVWDCNKQQKLTNGGMERLVQETLNHALPSMFTTSLTTAVAFFASIVSNVTAINCFSLFSGMTVIANFFLMVTWLPASVVISEHCRLSFLTPAHFVVRKILRPLRHLMERVSNVFSKCLTQLTISLRWFWFIGLGGIAIAGCMVVFRYPGLQLPDSPSFQLFDSSHPFEQYDLLYAKRFWFEKLEMGDGGAVLPLRFVWGVKPIDNGNYLDPSARGTFIQDENFDVTHPKSQQWLQQFCRNLRNQPFYRSTLGPLLPNCFIDTLKDWMERRCEDPADPHADRLPCCERNTFPYKPEVLRECAAEASNVLHQTPVHLWAHGAPVTAGLKFLRELIEVSTLKNNSKKISFIPKIKALVVEYDSTFVYSLSFAEMNQFYNQVETWMQGQLASAPPGMKGGWFVSRLEFYELQRTLYEGTIWAMIVSMALALTVLGFVTLNFLVSLYAIIAIGAAIVVTIAGLIILGWRLNVLESVAVSTAIGLAIDFSLHYGVSYRACSLENSVDRVTAALKQMGGPTLMAAITSGAAGALMLPSHVLAYIQIGVFLLLVMGVSWMYATFFLCPLLAIAGPSPTFAQFQYPRLWRSMFNIHKNKGGNTTEVDREVSTNRRRVERSKPEFHKSRWLEAIWEPGARIYSLPGGIDMMDISGDGDARLITADLGNSVQDTARIRVFKEGDQVTEHNMVDLPCGVVGFYSENGDPRSAALAVGASSSVYIFKNMRPHFKYCLPYLDAHPKEREIWHKAGLEIELNISALSDDLELLLNELGAGFMSPRTLKFLAMDKNLRASFAEQYRVVPLIKMNAITTIGIARKDSWNDFPTSYILVGTESGEIFMLDPRAFFVVERLIIGWPPVSTTSTGLWTGDGQIIVVGRDGQLGSVKKGSSFKEWDNLPAPIVAVAPLTCEGAAVVLMDGTYYGFSRTGTKMWRINLPGMPLDLVSLPVRQSVVSLLAVSIAGIGVKIYDEKHHVDTIKMMDSVSAMKYGRLGQEERAMSMVTTGGGLCVKILKRTADFSIRSSTNENINSGSNFAIPKKTRLFVEQTLRERTEATKIHKTFQQGLIRLRLTVAKRAYEAITTKQESIYHPISLEPSVLGLGPRYRIRTIVTNVTDLPSDNGLFFVYKTDNVDCQPRVTNVPILAPGIPIPFSSNAILLNEKLPGKVRILLCKKDNIRPLQIVNVMLPVAESDIEI